MLFTRFTREARRCVAAAPEEARLLGHDSVGDEDILLGILQSHDTLASQVLADAGVDTESVRHESGQMMSDALANIGVSLEDIKRETGEAFDISLPEDQKIPFSPRAKKVLERSLKEALELGANDLTVEHLLLAVLHLEDGSAARILTRLGVSPQRVREALISSLET